MNKHEFASYKSKMEALHRVRKYYENWKSTTHKIPNSTLQQLYESIDSMELVYQKYIVDRKMYLKFGPISSMVVENGFSIVRHKLKFPSVN